MKKNSPLGNISSGGSTKDVIKKITSKIDTGRKRVVTGTITTTSSTNNSDAVDSTSIIRNKQITKTLGSTSSLKSTSSSGTSTFPRSLKQGRPCQPSKDPNVRAFVQANARVTNMTALFHDEVDTTSLSNALVKNARASGVLNLSGRNLINVPMKVWRINELDENERSSVSVSLDDNNSDEKWWEFVDLQKLIIANNYIKDVPCDISNLHSLQTFDVSNLYLTFLKETKDAIYISCLFPGS
jgi:Leucine-rich repeat (LRR) protein